jgi:hypothetical protein
MLVFITTAGHSYSQTLYARAAHVNIQSDNSIKKVEADNYQVNSLIDLDKGLISFEALLRSFEFKLGILDRAFNSDKLNLSQYPKIKFEGTIKGLENINLAEFGEYPVEVDGTLYLWDEKRKTSASGTVTSIGDNKQVFASSGFTITIEQKSMEKVNQLIRDKLPLKVDASSFGVSRDILILLDSTYKVR